MHSRFVAVLTGFLLLVAVTFAVTAAQAKVNYVTDHLQVTVRTGPDVSHKIIAMASSGEAVDVLQVTENGWARVRLGSGKEGWMLERFLMPDKTAAQKLAELDPQAKSMAERLDELNRANQTLADELAETRRQAQAVQVEYEKLKKASSGVLKLRKEHEALKLEYDKQAKEMKELSAENDSLKFAHNFKWFLAGAGVLIVGWFMGLALHRRKKRWTSTY